MNRNKTPSIAKTLCILLLIVGSAQAARRGDFQTFNLTPVAPPTPALKYELLFDPIDQTPENAADFYKQAEPLMTKSLNAQVNDAIDASDDHDITTVEAIDADLAPQTRDILDLLDKAGRCDHCDWQSHIREKGLMALLPYLNYTRMMAHLLYIHAMAQTKSGKEQDALATLRLGYELAQNAAADETFVNGLIANGIESLMNQALSQLMGREKSPNLYWALLELPGCKDFFRRAVMGNRYTLTAPIPLLRQARTRNLTAAEWHDVFNQIADFQRMMTAPSNNHPLPPAVDQHVLPAAQAYYAQTNNLSPDDVAKFHPLQVIGPYYFEQYQVASDDIFKLVNFPYPLLRAKLAAAEMAQRPLRASEPDNPFLPFLPLGNHAMEFFSRTDRTLAALTAVEAMRSYAAANNSQLPQHLADITDTPAPDNPRSGKPFDYAVNGDTATLSDADPAEYPLTYTIKIRH